VNRFRNCLPKAWNVELVPQATRRLRSRNTTGVLENCRSFGENAPADTEGQDCHSPTAPLPCLLSDNRADQKIAGPLSSCIGGISMCRQVRRQGSIGKRYARRAGGATGLRRADRFSSILRVITDHLRRHRSYSIQLTRGNHLSGVQEPSSPTSQISVSHRPRQPMWRAEAATRTNS